MGFFDFLKCLFLKKYERNIFSGHIIIPLYKKLYIYFNIYFFPWEIFPMGIFSHFARWEFFPAGLFFPREKNPMGFFKNSFSCTNVM